MSDRENNERSDLEWQMLLKSIPLKQIQDFIDDQNGVYNKRPRIFVKVSGGLVQGTVSDVPIKLVVIDYDQDSTPKDELVEIPEQDGDYDDAYCYEEAPLVDAGYCDQLETACEV